MSKRKNASTLKTVEATIKALGGPRAISRWSGALETSIGNWKSAGYIPATWYHLFATRLKELGFDVDPFVFGFKTVPLDGEVRRVA